MKLLSAPVIYGLAVALAGALIWGGVQTVRLAEAERDTAKAEGALAIVARDAAIARAEFDAGARLTERTHQADLTSIEESYRDQFIEAEKSGDRITADLLADNRKLRNHWQGCIATSAVSGAAGSVGRVDDGTRLRAESAGRVLRAVAECEAQVTGLQGVVRANVRATQK